MSPYKNIIFDFGGVILNIDYKLTENAFAKLGLENFEGIYSKASQTNLFDAFERGMIRPEDFRKEIRKYISNAASDSQIDAAWNSMLLDLPKQRIDFISSLKKDHRVFLLSNTNEIHFSAFTSNMNKEFGKNVFPDMFHKTYFSHRVKMRKPDAEIFELILNENDLKTKETLFIDDSIQHIEGARAIGLNTHHLQKNETIIDLFC